MIKQILEELELKISEIETQISEDRSNVDFESKYYELQDVFRETEERTDMSSKPNMTESDWKQSEEIKSSLKEMKIRINEIGSHAGIVQKEDLWSNMNPDEDSENNEDWS